MKNFLLFIALSLISIFTAQAQEKGSIVGKITDKEMNDDVLPFANVLIKGTTKGTTTDVDGLYEIAGLDAGTYTVVVSFVGYETLEIPGVKVEPGKVTELNTGLGASSMALDEVVITTTARRDSETALMLDQKRAIEFQQSIGAQELARKGVSNAEHAVTKTSGVTKVASRGVFVRGLDERYNFLTLNNLPISPVNWEAKIPSLDLFTSSIINKIDVNKVFYSNLYGDFAGASINVDTKEMPNINSTEISFSVGANLQSLDNDFLTDKEDGKLHYFGFGGADARKIPSALGSLKQGDPVFRASGEDAVGAFKSDWNTEKADTPISTGVSISNQGIISKKDNGNRTSYYLGMSFSNDYNSHIGSSFLRNPRGSLLRRIEKDNTFSYKTSANTLFSLFHKSQKSYLNLNYLFLKTTDNGVSDNLGRHTEVSANLLGRDSKYTQSYLHQFQLKGKYDLNTLSNLDYGVTFGTSNYAQPDNNIIALEETVQGDFIFSSSSGRMYKYFLDSDNNNIAGHLGYNINFETNKTEDDYNSLKMAVDYNRENLDIHNYFVVVQLPNTGGISMDENDIDASLNNAFINGSARYNELVDTRFMDIKTDIIGGNVNYNHHFNEKLSILAGARLENFRRTLGEESLGDEAYEFKQFFVLPNLNVRYALSENSNLRLAASKTYTKPKNIEIVNITRQNSLGDLIKGNPELENSDNYNIDIKYEIFPDRNSLFSVNLFGKYIKNPIERLVQDSGSFIQTVFQNTDKAHVYGAEFEFRTTFGYLLNNEVWDNLFIGANVTLMDSEASISEEMQSELNLTNRKRRLQGASNLLLNADISYQADFSEKFESQFTLLYDTFSKRISRVGSGTGSVKYEDEFEQPFHNLSFLWKNTINNKFSTSFKVSNILDSTYERTIEGISEEVSNLSYTLGRSVSLSVSYKF